MILNLMYGYSKSYNEYNLSLLTILNERTILMIHISTLPINVGPVDIIDR